MPFGVREGINVFLAGCEHCARRSRTAHRARRSFVPTENLRFREDALSFKVSERADEIIVGCVRCVAALLSISALVIAVGVARSEREHASYEYPTMTKTLGCVATTTATNAHHSSHLSLALVAAHSR